MQGAAQPLALLKVSPQNASRKLLAFTGGYRYSPDTLHASWGITIMTKLAGMYELRPALREPGELEHEFRPTLTERRWLAEREAAAHAAQVDMNARAEKSRSAKEAVMAAWRAYDATRGLSDVERESAWRAVLAAQEVWLSV
jgi:hypothetical protein